MVQNDFEFYCFDLSVSKQLETLYKVLLESRLSEFHDKESDKPKTRTRRKRLPIIEVKK